MFGEIGAWLYKGLGGIKPDPEHPGFKNILLQPHFVSGLDHFSASYQTPYGKVVSSWKKNGKKVMYTVVVPPNANATLHLELEDKQKLYKDGVQVNRIDQPMEIPSGSYMFEIK
jgi:alpha-L-rhamnosidase